VLLAITPAKLQKINIEDDSVSEDVQLLQGDVLIYEPNELQMSFFGRARIIELVVMPRFAGQKLLIASAGISDWLADPFHYSFDGVFVYPELGKSSFSTPSLVYAESIGGKATSDFSREQSFTELMSQTSSQNLFREKSAMYPTF
jgi:hypothetical protein